VSGAGFKSVKISKTDGFDIVIDTIASDKSISHRCAIFSLLSNEVSIIKNFLKAEDTLNSLDIATKLGAVANFDGDILTIEPPVSLIEPDGVLDCGNSGTTIRLMSGFLASREGFYVLSGDKYLRKRPMRRVAEPLRSVGALIDGRDGGNLAPLSIRGRKLKAINFDSKISSAQVKSALILAGLNSEGEGSFSEPEISRDHTERMLKGMGADIRVDDKIHFSPLTKALKPLNITVPSDPSSGFFFAVAAAITPKSKVTLKNVTLNPTRIEAYKILQKMGAKVEFITTEDIYEPIGDIIVSHDKLIGVEVSENISWLIDELPALSIAMAMADGKSTVRNAKELRVKESDRITCVMDNLGLCGIKTKEFEDGYEIEGSTLKSAKLNSHGDHRIAMSFAIAGLVNGSEVDDFGAVSTSFPNFLEILSKITQAVEI
jgi:3-phosphoshikimate 1-carboxyvinyltransferase